MCIIHCASSHVAHCETSHVEIGERRGDEKAGHTLATLHVFSLSLSLALASKLPINKLF